MTVKQHMRRMTKQGCEFVLLTCIALLYHLLYA